MKNLIKLTHLDLHSNSIEDVSSLKDLTNLSYVQLHGNWILDIEVLDNLKESGTNIEIMGTFMNGNKKGGF